MCGIVGYIGNRPTFNSLLYGLKRLEYRGYDSAGTAVFYNNKLKTIKTSGTVSDLQERIDNNYPELKENCKSAGIAHTRWATHGYPTEVNAHPHKDNSGEFAIVHNGMIENYSSLKKQLENKGRKFESATDSEVIIQLIAECYENDLLQATAAAIKYLRGTFGIAVISTKQPDRIIAARRGSPIVLGLGHDEMLVASDVAALVSYTKRVIYLDDDDIADVRADDVNLYNVDSVPVTRETSQIEWDPEEAEKGGYEHFMLKEIFEQPHSIENAIRGRFDLERGTTKLNGFNFSPKEMIGISNVIITACGTSYYAGMLAKYFFEDLADVPAEVAQAAEFRYRNPIIKPGSLVISVSQSGETADTLAAIREAQEKGATVAGLCNVIGSSIARATGRGVYMHAGPEISVASTKAFSAQAAILLMTALKFGRAKRLSEEAGKELANEILKLPDLVNKVLETAPDIEKVARKYSDAKNAFYIGRGYLYPAALEGALKLKEISYIHAEGYHASELKHGPLALLDEDLPVIALTNETNTREKVLGNIQECKARKAPVIATVFSDDNEVKNLVDDFIEIPDSSKFISPFLTVVALQLFSYYSAKARGCPIDKPKNLAKSVTVE